MGITGFKNKYTRFIIIVYFIYSLLHLYFINLINLKLVLTNDKCQLDSDCIYVKNSICHPGAGACICPSGTIYVPEEQSCKLISATNLLSNIIIVISEFYMDVNAHTIQFRLILTSYGINHISINLKHQSQLIVHK
ncbi:uncharacterized protein DC041_0003002 [Schistosoma bovis]|uniref:Uncharacterized protein n=1 Tax=Schistosoma bovis TaxID=6184 RepID=A0A430QFS6_SCHBO|nr:uncharacterized protein DC041_0003002 [Schistosoma bovis]